MQEVYWITRLDMLLNLMGTFAFFGVGAIIMYYVLKMVSENPGFNDGWKTVYETGMKWCRWVAVLAFIGVPGCVFIPSTEDALLIAGVGGTVDYIRANPTARNIPDKAIKALDKFADDYIYKDDNNNNDSRR